MNQGQVRGIENVASPWIDSGLWKKHLCDRAVQPSTGCTHSCSFCYVPNQPGISLRNKTLQSWGVDDPFLDWGKYLFVRKNLPALIEQKLASHRSWPCTQQGKGVVMFSTTTDPCVNREVWEITQQCITTLLSYNKRVRLLTRSPLWTKNIPLFQNPNAIVGASLPYFREDWARQLEGQSPLPQSRYESLIKGHKAGVRTFAAIAPTPPQMSKKEFVEHLEKLMLFDPEVLFWEPINPRGSNLERMRLRGIDWVDQLADKQAWAENFMRQWGELQEAAIEVGCIDRIHPWPDAQLQKCKVDNWDTVEFYNHWLNFPTPEKWHPTEKR